MHTHAKKYKVKKITANDRRKNWLENIKIQGMVGMYLEWREEQKRVKKTVRDRKIDSIRRYSHSALTLESKTTEYKAKTNFQLG